MKILIAGLCMAAVLLPTNALAQSQRPGRPNIIFIMTDDHAAHAIGAYGSKVNTTPHLDRLAREGANHSIYRNPANDRCCAVPQYRLHHQD